MYQLPAKLFLRILLEKKQSVTKWFIVQLKTWSKYVCSVVVQPSSPRINGSLILESMVHWSRSAEGLVTKWLATDPVQTKPLPPPMLAEVILDRANTAAELCGLLSTETTATGENFRFCGKNACFATIKRAYRFRLNIRLIRQIFINLQLTLSSIWLYLAMSLCSVRSIIIATIPDRKSTITTEFKMLTSQTVQN